LAPIITLGQSKIYEDWNAAPDVIHAQNIAFSGLMYFNGKKKLFYFSFLPLRV
jgi:hypothetical protein